MQPRRGAWGSRQPARWVDLFALSVLACCACERVQVVECAGALPLVHVGRQNLRILPPQHRLGHNTECNTHMWLGGASKCSCCCGLTGGRHNLTHPPAAACPLQWLRHPIRKRGPVWCWRRQGGRRTRRWHRPYMRSLGCCPPRVPAEAVRKKGTVGNFDAPRGPNLLTGGNCHHLSENRFTTRPWTLHSIVTFLRKARLQTDTRTHACACDARRKPASGKQQASHQR